MMDRNDSCFQKSDDKPNVRAGPTHGDHRSKKNKSTGQIVYPVRENDHISTSECFQSIVPDIDRSKAKSYTRIKIEGPPITKIKDVPKEWDINDSDINPKDLNAVIQRCKDRIEDGIMPQIWERKLRTYEVERAKQLQIIQNAPRGLSVIVIQRIGTLKSIGRQLALRRNDDAKLQLANVNAIIDAYCSKTLTWQPEKVTYWQKGKMLAGPKKFDWDDFFRLSRDYNGEKDFWVEGIRGPGFCPQYVWRGLTSVPTTFAGIHTLTFLLRVPGREDRQRHLRFPVMLDFIDDTGADTMLICQEDLDLISANDGATPRILGELPSAMAGGKFLSCPVVALEVMLYDPDGDERLPYSRVRPWMPVEVGILQEPTTGFADPTCLRSSGPWLRHALYVGSAPANAMMRSIARTKEDLFELLPTSDYREVPPVAPNPLIFPPEEQ